MNVAADGEKKNINISLMTHQFCVLHKNAVEFVCLALRQLSASLFPAVWCGVPQVFSEPSESWKIRGVL